MSTAAETGAPLDGEANDPVAPAVELEPRTADLKVHPAVR
jgi:hypothetical protein